MKNWLIGKDPDARKDWRQEEEMTEDEMVGWQHWVNVHEFEQALGVGDGQGSLASCSPWYCRVWLRDWTELIFFVELSLFKFSPLSTWIFWPFYNRSFRIIYFWYIFYRCVVYKYFLEVYNLFLPSWALFCRSKFCFNFY